MLIFSTSLFCFFFRECWTHFFFLHANQQIKLVKEKDVCVTLRKNITLNDIKFDILCVCV